MFRKTLHCSAWILALYAIVAAVPVIAGDASNLAARAASWEKDYNADGKMAWGTGTWKIQCDIWNSDMAIPAEKAT